MKLLDRPTLDKQTGLEIVLACCTYNSACAYLDKVNADNHYGNFVGAMGNANEAEIVYEKARFLFEAERGILLRKE